MIFQEVVFCCHILLSHFIPDVFMFGSRQTSARTISAMSPQRWRVSLPPDVIVRWTGPTRVPYKLLLSSPRELSSSKFRSVGSCSGHRCFCQSSFPSLRRTLRLAHIAFLSSKAVSLGLLLSLAESLIVQLFRPRTRADSRIIGWSSLICVSSSKCVYMCVTVWVCFGSILGPFWVHSGSILGPFWVHFGSILGPFCLLFEWWCILKV